MFVLVLIIIGAYLIFKLSRKYKVKIDTFFKKGVKVNRGRFGNYCYCAKQGLGKTANAIEFIYNNRNTGYSIYTNMTSITCFDYTYFNGLDGLLELQRQNVKHAIILYDEIFTLLTRDTKLTRDVLSFLSQMRKRDIIFITTAQEWLEIPITLRRYCRYQINCNVRNLLFSSISLKSIGDAENMIYNKEISEYECPLVCMTISKMNKYILNSYDTLETIDPHNTIYPIPIQTYREQQTKNT